MTGASRTPRPSEETFKNKVWSMIPHLVNCLWYQTLWENALEYSRMIRTGLEEMEKQIEAENKKPE